MEGREYIDLLELQTCIKESVAEAFPDRFWVRAEIASYSPRSNGHCYLDLAQSRGGKPVAQIRAMIWKWHYVRLKTYFEDLAGQPLQAGITVLVKVQVSYSELFGISLFIEDIDPAFTLGEQALERKRTIERLQKDGYMEMQQELALPDVPRRLAIITSKTAAGYQDFRHHLLDNPEGYAFELQLFEALMQGEQAPASVADALEEAAGQAFDAILILRGGGSEMDLQCFDDENLAIAIATCPVPVVTAIGHDKDVHIADMVAHQAVKTPTALADVFLRLTEEADERVSSFENRLALAFRNRLAALESAVTLLETRIAATDPRNVLKRGFSLVLDERGVRIAGVKGRKKGDRVSVVFADGRLNTEVKEVL